MRMTVVVTAAGLGIEGLGSAFVGPGADLAVITGAWMAMITTLAVQAGVEIDKDVALKITSASLLSLGSFIGGTKLAVQAFAFTGVGTVPAIVANCGINAVVTYLTGMAVASIFLQDRRVDSAEAFVRAVVNMVLSALGIGGDGRTPSA